MDKVIVFGGAAGSKISKDIFDRWGVKVIAFANNYLPPAERYYLKAPVISFEEGIDYLIKHKTCDYFVATGDNFLRKSITNNIVGQVGKKPGNAIHPSAVISASVRIGHGNLIMPLAVINASAVIGDGTIINTGSIIEHDNVIEDYAQISPGVALGGYVTVKTLASIGLNSSIIPHKIVGEGAEVAAGSAVIGDVEPYTMVAGVPAVYKKDVHNETRRV